MPVYRVKGLNACCAADKNYKILYFIFIFGCDFLP